MEIIKPGTKIDFMKKRRIFAVVSGVLVLISLLLALVYPTPKFGIDFEGGTEIQLLVGKGMDSAVLRRSIKELGFSNPDIVSVGVGSEEFLIRIRSYSPVSESTQNKAREALKKALPDVKLSEFELSPGGDKLTLKFDADVDRNLISATLEKSGLELRRIKLEEKDKSKDKEDEAGAVKVEPQDQAAAAPDSEDEIDDEDEEKEGSSRCIDPVCPRGPKEDHIFEVFLKGIGSVVVEGLQKKLGTDKIKEARRIEWVGPKIGQQLRNSGIKSLLYALAFIMLYIAFRFDLRYAPGAVVALIHDILLTIGIFTALRINVSLETIAALLTIVGYSLNDTIVVFDRIRENFQKMRERELAKVVNQSINETLSRTLLTSLTTFVVVLVIWLLASGPIKNFSFTLMIGVIIGTYSSIFIASPIVVWLDRRFFSKK